jgi:hypothetical protein
MSRNIICVLIYHRHKPLDHINIHIRKFKSFGCLYFVMCFPYAEKMKICIVLCILIIHSRNCIYSIQIFYFKELWRSIEVNAEGNCNAPTKSCISWRNWNGTNEIVQISQSMVNVCRVGGKLWHIQGNTLPLLIMFCISL